MTKASHGPRRLDKQLLADLTDIVPRGIKFDVPLNELSRWRIGGRARVVVNADCVEHIQAVTSLTTKHQCPLVVVGDSANLLFDSKGFEGVLLRLAGSLRDVRAVGRSILQVGAGCSVDSLADFAADCGLSGLEHIAGIPGTVGGLIAMNGGSQRRGIGSSVQVLDAVTRTGERVAIDQISADFGYRSSAFQTNGSVIAQATLGLQVSKANEVRASIASIRAERQRKFPSDEANCGSTFLSDPAMYDIIGPPGRAIEDAGLKGLRRGGAVISRLHANFINNVGDATSDDVLWLVAAVQCRVEDRTGFAMKCEVRHVAADGIVRPADESAAEKWDASDFTFCQ
ncbi:UDP-N-acetylmuramate dehydrogenase [Gordonia sp. NPDC127522]|uniref:UDP-N-acetylmuramate dehydrogenase n=1 Tax=Gordonia sp. NPDC127522 TaxID=3345390 RepID=UPI003625EBC4